MILVAGVLVLGGWPLRAHYGPILLEQVPIDRVVANLEVQARARPADALVQINLARAHGMAYAKKTERADVIKGKPERGVYFGQEPANVPFRAEATSDPVKQAAASVHLKKSIEHFTAALAIAPDNLVARLGLAWMTHQSGDKVAAIAAYRDVIERAWKVEGQLKRADLGFVPVTAEAADYLIPLLNPTVDAQEIATLRERSQKLRRLPRPITPIAVPLRDGLSFGSVLDDDAAVNFDGDGLGRKSWSWITPDAAWLVYDQLGNGEIRSALQLFGSVTFWMFWDTGYDAMGALDDNHDGRLAGTELRHLGLWRDVNSNGVSERGEVRSLASYDIVSMSYAFTRANDPVRTPFVERGVTFKDGTTRPTWDVILEPAR
ncbi:MAG TPA: hypothetical protein VFV98_14425 [Vicinamibacterales bacterium]|nr:hypothetical protein [Vicinamibacterales bacterium]